MSQLANSYTGEHKMKLNKWKVNRAELALAISNIKDSINSLQIEDSRKKEAYIAWYVKSFMSLKDGITVDEITKNVLQ